MSVCPIKVSPQTLNDALKGDKAVYIVDVREPSEYHREHIAKAHLHPIGSLNPDTILKAAGKRAAVYVICASGGRSAKGASVLADAIAKGNGVYGSAEIYDVSGGMSAWRLNKLPVVEDKSAPLPIIRQVHTIASVLIISGTLLTRYYNRDFFVLPLCVGCGLMMSGVTGFCGMAMILKHLPYNKNA